MCGIAGIYTYADSAPPVDTAELIAIRDAMKTRGPDGDGLWVNEKKSVALAHRRLAIIDLSHQAAQPMHSADGALSITFNGEIYNYQTLRKQLEKKGCLFQSTSDTEVILHLYATYGTALFSHLRGMYAFAIWDNDKQSLLLGP